MIAGKREDAMLEPEDLHEDHQLSEKQSVIFLVMAAALAVAVALITSNV